MANIESMLKTGRGQPTTAAELAARLGINRRTVFKQISRERAAGALIIGCNDGFYLAENNDDLAAFERRTRARGARMISAGTAARRELKKQPGQIELYSTTNGAQTDPANETPIND